MNLIKTLIGEIEPTIETTINDIECLTNKKSIVIKTDSIEKVKSILGSDFDTIQLWMPDSVIFKKFCKEYPALPLMKSEMQENGKDLPYPDSFYYGKGKSLVVEIKDDLYIFSPINW